METAQQPLVCKACGTASKGTYCPNCGQKMAVKRISLPDLLHEAMHLFTHVEHGFFFTLKELITAPGKMQRNYINGNRVNYQKPFSMFFITGTISALLYFWVNSLLIRYFSSGDAGEAEFFRRYWVLLQIALLPIYSLVIYLFFRKAKFNYGEIAVFQLYAFSFVFLLVSCLQLVKFFSHHLETRYLEVPLVLLYTILTNLNFFKGMKKGKVILLSLVSIVLNFLLAALVQDTIIRMAFQN